MERKESCHIRSLSFTPLSYFLNLKQHMPRQPARQLAHQQWTMHGIPRSSRLLLQLNYSSISHERRKQASKQASKQGELACLLLSFEARNLRSPVALLPSSSINLETSLALRIHSEEARSSVAQTWYLLFTWPPKGERISLSRCAVSRASPRKANEPPAAESRREFEASTRRLLNVRTYIHTFI